MSREIKEGLKLNIDSIAIRKYRVRDLNGSTAFQLSSGTWALSRRTDGVVILSSDVTINNADVDAFGNTIKTVSMTINLRSTDSFTLGAYYLVVETVLVTGQTDFFRVPVELVDYRTKGAA